MEVLATKLADLNLIPQDLHSGRRELTPATSSLASSSTLSHMVCSSPQTNASKKFNHYRQFTIKPRVGGADNTDTDAQLGASP